MTPYELYCYANKLMDNKLYQEAVEYYKEFLSYKESTIDVKLSACDRLASIYEYLGDNAKKQKYILKSFQYDSPRAEFCCRLGFDLLNRDELNKSIFWYSLALILEKPKFTSVFFNEACWTWLPHLQLCICYYRLNEYERAYDHIKKALSFCPDNEVILQNKALLEELLEKKETQDKETSSNASFLSKRPLRIVQVAPDAITVPPKNYGGIERVVYDLSEELIRRGHEVYLYAPSGSHSSATLIPYVHKRVDSSEIAKFVSETLPDNIDIIHDHTHASVIDKLNLPITTICTIHDSRPNSAKNPVYLCKRALELVGRNNGYYVYNGIDLNDYDFCDKKEDYLLFLGVLNWHKGINYAIDVAERTNQKLVVAGPVFHPDYFNKEIRPRILNNPNIQYVGEVGGKIRRDLLKHARCMLFPTSWEEPFGLVMVEAMASGTPVIAFANGAVSEVLSGFPELICRSVDEMAEKVMRLTLPSPSSLREYVLNNFTAATMTDSYLSLYNKLLNKNQSH